MDRKCTPVLSRHIPLRRNVPRVKDLDTVARLKSDKILIPDSSASLGNRSISQYGPRGSTDDPRFAPSDSELRGSKNVNYLAGSSPGAKTWANCWSLRKH